MIDAAGNPAGSFRLKKRVSIETLGCKLNQVDGEAIREAFERAGYEAVPFGEAADVYVVNTCTVTGETDHQSRQLLRRMMKFRERGGGGIVVAAGCYTQTDPERLARLAPGIDLMVGSTDKERIPELIEGLAPAGAAGPVLRIGDVMAEREFRVSRLGAFAGRSRAFLRVQDGCNRRCSYCIVPYARGPERSAPLDVAAAQAAEFAALGFAEIVVTGVHVGRYGAGVQGASLAALLARLSDIPGIRRIRLSSLDPGEMTDEIYTALDAAREKLCPHFHLSIQSCCDSVLRRMNRDYTYNDCREAVSRLRALYPDASVGADIIVGFPGESDADYEETRLRIRELELSYMHIFRYSKRRGTPAAEMADQVDPAVKKTRSRELHELRAELVSEFRERFAGAEAEVLFESRRDRRTGRLTGLTRNYIRAFAEGPDEFMGRLAAVRIDGANEFGISVSDLKLIED